MPELLGAGFDPLLLSRIEDAGLNASAPPQQRWIDGWLVRYSPGKARRARCINAVAPGRLPLDDKLQRAAAVYAEAALPMVVRITPFTQPVALDSALAKLGWAEVDNTRVMVRPAQAAGLSVLRNLPSGLHWQALGAPAYADAVGALRGSSSEQVQAHFQRLALSPVAYQGFALSNTDGVLQACGQFAREGDLVGLYDVFTRQQARRQGLAAFLCERLLTLAAREGGVIAYLQVEADNAQARRVYLQLGFSDGYSYRYRQPAGA